MFPDQAFSRHAGGNLFPRSGTAVAVATGGLPIDHAAPYREPAEHRERPKHLNKRPCRAAAKALAMGQLRTLLLYEPMKSCRIHIVGASGAGVTTLGRALAAALAFPHHDTDDYFWFPTTPPYRRMRERDDRLRLVRDVFLERPDWVLSGSIDSWGDSIAPLFDVVAFRTGSDRDSYQATIP